MIQEQLKKGGGWICAVDPFHGTVCSRFPLPSWHLLWSITKDTFQSPSWLISCPLPGLPPVKILPQTTHNLPPPRRHFTCSDVARLQCASRRCNIHGIVSGLLEADWRSAVDPLQNCATNRAYPTTSEVAHS